jgi:hypothetical protein
MRRWNSERRPERKREEPTKREGGSYYRQAVEKLDDYERRTRQLFDRVDLIQDEYGLKQPQPRDIKKAPKT